MKRSRAAARIDAPSTPSAIPAVVAAHPPPPADFAHATRALVLTVAADPGAVPAASVAKAPPVLPAGWVAPSVRRKFMIEITEDDQWRRVEQARPAHGGAGAHGSITDSAAASSFIETESCAAAAAVPANGRPRRRAHLRAKRLLELEHAHATSSAQRAPHIVAGASMHGEELSASADAFHRREVEREMDAAIAALLQKAASFKRYRLQLASSQWPLVERSDPPLPDRSALFATTSAATLCCPDSTPSEPRELNRWLRDDADSAVSFVHDAQAASAATVGSASLQPQPHDQDQRPRQLHLFFRQQPAASTKNTGPNDNQSRVQLRSLFQSLECARIGLATL